MASIIYLPRLEKTGVSGHIRKKEVTGTRKKSAAESGASGDRKTIISPVVLMYFYPFFVPNGNIKARIAHH
jgi:hypothetical protein